MRNAGDAYKGEGVMQGYLFFEVNDVNPLNTLSFQLENGKLLWDVVVLFAANTTMMLKQDVLVYNVTRMYSICWIIMKLFFSHCVDVV